MRAHWPFVREFLRLLLLFAAVSLLATQLVPLVWDLLGPAGAQ